MYIWKGFLALGVSWSAEGNNLTYNPFIFTENMLSSKNHSDRFSSHCPMFWKLQLSWLYRCSDCIRIYHLPMWCLSVHFHFLFLKLYAECCIFYCLFCIPSTFLFTSFYCPRGGILWAFISIRLELHPATSSQFMWSHS